MKIVTLAALAAITFCGTASAQQYVSGYTRANGTYVQGYWRSSPNSTRMDNYSTRGNVNPYTGQAGTVNPYIPPTTGYVTPTYTPPPVQINTPEPAYSQPTVPVGLDQVTRSSYQQPVGCCR